MKKSYQQQNFQINQRIHSFLTDYCELKTASEIFLIPQDASKRIYYRAVSADGTSYIIMDTAEEPEVTEQFCRIATNLRKAGLNAPEIIQCDKSSSLTLMEDFGDKSFTNFLISDPDKEVGLYHKAIEVLAALSSAKFDIPLQNYDKKLLWQELEKFCNGYLPYRLKQDAIDKAVPALVSIFDNLFNQLKQDNKTIVLRDYHADNLMVLYRKQITEAGILDFQDAVFGSPAYDVVSLLEDARRDVLPQTVESSKKLFLELVSSLDKNIFEREYVILGMQRNLKIIGIFNTLYLNGRHKYKEYMPRVFNYIKEGLNNPIMSDLSYWFKHHKIDLYHD